MHLIFKDKRNFAKASGGVDLRRVRKHDFFNMVCNKEKDGDLCTIATSSLPLETSLSN